MRRGTEAIPGNGFDCYGIAVNYGFAIIDFTGPDF